MSTAVNYGHSDRRLEYVIQFRRCLETGRLDPTLGQLARDIFPVPETRRKTQCESPLQTS